MNAWQKRNQSSPQDNGVGRYAYLSTPSKGAPAFGSSLGHSAAASSRFRARLKMLSALLYVVGVLAMLLFVYGGWFELPDEDMLALDRVMFAGGMVVLSVWFFPWHRFGRNVLLVPSQPPS
jgi:hypothetical protein